MLEVIILFLAGIGAGLVTGLAGASAVMVAAPLLVVFLDYSAYLAIGVALSIDVSASFFATLIYYKNRRLRIKPTLILLIFSLMAVVIGSYFSKNIPSNNLGLATGIGIILAGISIAIKEKSDFLFAKKISFFKTHKVVFLIAAGLLIGTIAGIFGAGGGIMILLSLIFILGYKTHEAIGTSVFLMIFIALFGGATHYINMPFSVLSLAVGIIGGILGSIVASNFANILNEKTLNKITGTIVVALGISLVFKNIII